MINRIELPKEVIIASHNPGKVKEINILLNDIGIKAFPISLFSDIEPIENGSSFAENALIKARNARQLSNKTSLADDSGLCVDALDGAPGIYSARWAGAEKDFDLAMSLIEEKLQGIDNKKACFICALAIVNEKNEEYVFEGKINGALTFPKKGKRGFGYDPIFIPENHTITFGEMAPNKKDLISHRGVAFKKLKESIIVN